MEVKHSPLPWGIHKTDLHLYIVTDDDNGDNDSIAMADDDEDAEFIVRCANSHQQMIDALEACLDYPDNGIGCETEREARAALAQAKGER